MENSNYDVYNHPEAIMVNTVFGPAFCDTFNMMDRFTLFLKTMNDTMDYPGTVMCPEVMQRTPISHILSGRFAIAITGRPFGS